MAQQPDPEDPDDSDAQSDTSEGSSILTEISDSSSYFTEAGGRLFHSHSNNSHYPLPVDTPEQERLTVLHKCLHRVIGAHYVGPVQQHLRFVPGQPQKRVVDIGTGNGVWPMDMGEQFPHVLFRAFDLVPIATRFPLNNVRFEIDDLNNSETRWNADTIDMVHARDVSLAVRHLPSFLAEVTRILRPGGLFLSCEWGFYPAFHPDYRNGPAAIAAPGVARFYRELLNVLGSVEGIFPMEHATIPYRMAASGRFTRIISRKYYLPIGPWHVHPHVNETGQAMRWSLLVFADSVRPLFLRAGKSEADIEQIMERLRKDLKEVPYLVAEYHTVWAQKL